MENTVKHYNWNYVVEQAGTGPSGRVAVSLKDDRLIVEQITGSAPPVEILKSILDENPNLLVRGKTISEGRRYMFAVEVRDGMSGSTDILMRIKFREETKNYPITARLHISMYGKLNDGIDLWLGDFREFWPFIVFGTGHVDLCEVDTFEPDGGWVTARWSKASESGGDQRVFKSNGEGPKPPGATTGRATTEGLKMKWQAKIQYPYGQTYYIMVNGNSKKEAMEAARWMVRHSYTAVVITVTPAD